MTGCKWTQNKHTPVQISPHSDTLHTPWQDVLNSKIKLHIFSFHTTNLLRCLCLAAEDDGFNPAMCLPGCYAWFLWFCSTDGLKVLNIWVTVRINKDFSFPFFSLFVCTRVVPESTIPLWLPAIWSLIDELPRLALENAVESVSNLWPSGRVTLLQSSMMKLYHCSCHCRLLAAGVHWL